MDTLKPTPMAQIYFDHSQDQLSAALGISDERKTQLADSLGELSEKKDGKLIGKVSEKLEMLLKLARNEQERIYLTMVLARGVSTPFQAISHLLGIG